MLFNSFDFLLFFIVVFAVQWLLPHRPRNIFLLLASCFFYACWDWRFLGLLWITIVTDYTTSRCLEITETQWKRKALLAFSCSVNLGILMFFKYAMFFADSAARLLRQFSIDVPDWQLNILLPVGISFYTFQSMSYTIDVYQRKMQPLRSLIDYGLFVTLFPQMVAGPIERGTHLAAQIRKKTLPTWEDCCDGSWLVLKGLFKKVVLADNLAPIVDRVFSLDQPSGAEVLIGVYAFAFQIYGDFSGYTDIARGVGKWLGYDLMMNFRLPYFAVNPSDFWQRWHISLSTWLRDYLYIPLGGNRNGQFSTCRNLMLTMLLGGLWHGANWTYVAWGAYHGTLLVLFRLWSEYSSNASREPLQVNTFKWLVRVVVMFHLTCLGWLLFRAANLEQVSQMLMALSTHWTVSEAWYRELWQVAILCGPLLFVQWIEETSGKLDFVPRLSILPRSMAYASIMIAILSIGSFGGREFIYFQF
jgi:D-alanyl-lipoteichoic acid acyltransferase DltB (MBOAT superfamily)